MVASMRTLVAPGYQAQATTNVEACVMWKNISVSLLLQSARSDIVDLRERIKRLEAQFTSAAYTLEAERERHVIKIEALRGVRCLLLSKIFSEIEPGEVARCKGGGKLQGGEEDVHG
jgi:hypothetical protein